MALIIHGIFWLKLSLPKLRMTNHSGQLFKRRGMAMQSAVKRKIVEVDRGLFLVRYATADDAANPPKVKLSPDIGFGDDIRFVLHPDEDEAILSHPGTCLVMLVESRGKLVVDVVPARVQGSVAAKVNIEPLAQEDPAFRWSEAGRGDGPLELADFDILGHVASRGDLTVKANEWLAGPSAPSRIEGIQLEWRSKPSDLDIRYAVKTGRPQAASGQMVGLGTFAGSRGKALPIVGIALEMSGAAASRLQFSAEMIFLGSSLLRMTGKTVTGSGPTGREPLVGLRVNLESADAAAGREPSPVPPTRPAERVRVFRSVQPDQRRAG